jgi:hypothetical protein
MKKVIVPALLGALLVTVCGGGSGETDNTDTVQTNDALLGAAGNTTVNISYTVPFDLATNTATPAELCEFAWQEFIALNWQSSWSLDQKRDNPDKTWLFSSGDPDLTVWETFAHRTELRPATGTMGPFDQVPNYTYKDQKGPMPGTTPDSTLWNNLDENNEIGSCYLYAFADDGYNNMVLYEAKTNSAEYNYVLNNYSDSAALKSAISKTKANIATDSAYYPTGVLGASCDCPTADSVFCLPCGNNTTQSRGSIEIKTAWRMLHGSESADDYITRNTIVYEYDEVTDETYYTNREMALIGMHIIHKTKNYPAFVFATFEHVSVMTDKMAYIESGGGDTVVDFPRYATELIPAQAATATTNAHSAISDSNSNSVLLNYQLTGVQGTPSSDTSSFSFFLANYVIESDYMLGHFQGSFPKPHDPSVLNVLTVDPSMVRVSQGGCQGCHGAGGQLNGSDFSFIMSPDGFKEPDVDSALTIVAAEKFQQLLERSK